MVLIDNMKGQNKNVVNKKKKNLKNKIIIIKINKILEMKKNKGRK
jgi:hypothetical protein